MSEMARPIRDAKMGVAVKINPKNSKKILRITSKTHRTFASEVNVGVEEYADKKLAYRKDDGR